MGTNKAFSWRSVNAAHPHSVTTAKWIFFGAQTAERCEVRTGRDKRRLVRSVQPDLLYWISLVAFLTLSDGTCKVPAVVILFFFSPQTQRGPPGEFLPWLHPKETGEVVFGFVLRRQQADLRCLTGAESHWQEDSVNCAEKSSQRINMRASG